MAIGRRDAMKALAGLVSATGLTVTPITDRQADGIALLVFRTEKMMTLEQKRIIGDSLIEAIKGTTLEGVRCIVLDSGATLEAVSIRVSTGGKGSDHGDRQ